MSSKGDAALLSELLLGHYALDPAAPAWAHAFVACAQGRFSDALAIAQRHLDGPEAFEGQLRLTAGSALRQLGRHADAERIDSAPAVGTMSMHLTVSRAANHVGLGEFDQAQRLLDSVRTASTTGGSEWTRVSIRSEWVAAEVAFGRADPATALEHSRSAHREAKARSWPRHVAKSLLFQGVAAKELGQIEPARNVLRAAVDLAEPLGARPIVEVAARILDALAR